MVVAICVAWIPYMSVPGLVLVLQVLYIVQSCLHYGIHTSYTVLYKVQCTVPGIVGITSFGICHAWDATGLLYNVPPPSKKRPAKVEKEKNCCGGSERLPCLCSDCHFDVPRLSLLISEPVRNWTWHCTGQLNRNVVQSWYSAWNKLHTRKKTNIQGPPDSVSCTHTLRIH